MKEQNLRSKVTVGMNDGKEKEPMNNNEVIRTGEAIGTGEAIANGDAIAKDEAVANIEAGIRRHLTTRPFHTEPDPQLYAEAMKRFDILEKQGLAEDVREYFKKNIVLCSERKMFPTGDLMGLNTPIYNIEQGAEIIKTLYHKGFVPYYAILTDYQAAGKVLSVLVFSTDEEDMEMWDDERELMENHYALACSFNLTHGYEETGDVFYKAALGGLVVDA